MQTSVNLSTFTRSPGLALPTEHNGSPEELERSGPVKETSHQIKHLTLAIAVWCYSKRPFAKHVCFFPFVALLQMNLSTLWKINGDAVNNLDGFVRSRLLPAEVSILVVLSSHLRAAVNNLSEQVEAKMHQYHQLRWRETKFMYRWGEALCSRLHVCASFNCCL